jgi:hypothetical protein
LTISGTGCATIRIKSNEAQGQTGEAGAKSVTAHRWFWGFVWNSEVEAQTCAKLQSVHVKTTFWQGLVTVATLGIYCPTDVEWICAKLPVPKPCPEPEKK